MNMGIKWLEWSYPVLLWFMVACFSLLACRNVVAAAATSPQQPAPPISSFTQLLASNGSASTIR